MLMSMLLLLLMDHHHLQLLHYKIKALYKGSQ